MSFGGSDADLREVRATSALPLLKKDFHVHPLQVFEARALGASALLLIARALDEPMLRELAAIAHDVGLEVLIEVRDERELERALETDARMIGVNNRNLETLAIDLVTSELILPQIPSDRVAIAESGVRGPEEVERFARAGADAVLVGSSISGSADPATAVRALTQSLRRPRR
jgi:indole-3-glycerol phosphate synthase